MSYDAQRDRLSRTPCTLLVLSLDWCGNVFGQAPCTATGEPCYQTFTTCKDRLNYVKTSRDYAFSSLASPLPFPGPRPYLSEVRYLPTEIKDKLTVKGRATAELVDELDGDVGIDPYVDQRGSVQGTFWKKWLARNRHWQGRPARIYEGFVGEPQEEFRLRWAGAIDNVSLKNGKVSFEIVDLLQDLEEIELPPEVSAALHVTLTADGTEAYLNTLAGLPVAGHVRIGDEILAYTGVDTAQIKLTGLTRAQAGTEAAAHDAGTQVEIVIYYAPQNPFDLLLSMLSSSPDITVDNPPGAGIAAELVDAAAFAYCRNWPVQDIDVSTWLVRREKLSVLFFEIVSLLDAFVWQDESQRLTIRRAVPNEPDRDYVELTDAAHIGLKTGAVDLNDKARRNVVIIHWDRTALGETDDKDSYRAVEVAVDADDLGENGSNDIREDKLFTRWLRRGYLQDEVIAGYLTDLALRRLFHRIEAQPIIDFSVELKDEGVLTGQHVRLTTDELLLPDGSPLPAEIFRIWKREPKNNLVAFRAVRVQQRRFCFVAPDETPDYDAATPAQREYGFLTDDEGFLGDLQDGYYIY